MRGPIVRQARPIPGYTRPPGSIWIDDHRADLPNNEWVAADGSGFVANDPAFDGLIDKIRRRGVDIANVTIAYISSEPI